MLDGQSPKSIKSMRTGRDATRRNRNIGTAKQGYGQDNKLVISTRRYPDWLVYYENLKNYRTARRTLHGHVITFLVEETRLDCYHACTVDDIAYLLRFVPATDLHGIELIVLRQPKRKEEILAGAWGRWASYVVIDDYRGSAIFLESVDIAKPMRWSKSLAPEGQKELERLRGDGHTITTTQRHYLILSGLESTRSTQLYRTLLHEIGHHVDYTHDPAGFDRKPSDEKEMFAHQYADKLKTSLEKRRWIPFERILSDKSIKKDRLRISDFKAI
jgi:hypothetical protein